MENTLYIVANINLETVNLVASCLHRRYEEGFSKIVLFESREAEKHDYAQTQILREYFGSFEKSVILLNDDGSIPSERLYSVFQYEGNKVIDLSNGPKVTTSALYMASTLCRLTDIYCLMLHGKPSPDMIEGKDFEYLKLQRIQGIEKLAKLSYFDLIYYTEEVKALISEDDRKRSGRMKAIYDGMLQGIGGFFADSMDARSVINNVTIGVESIMNAFLDYLRANPTASGFATKNSIDLNYKGDPIGILSRFCKTYVRTEWDMQLICLCTVPGLLSGLRDYRNISAHYTRNHVILTDDNARTVINMQIEVLKCVHKNKTLWRSL